MAKLINQRRNDEIGTSIFRDLIYGLRSFREVLELEVIQNDINKRLADIEGSKYQQPEGMIHLRIEHGVKNCFSKIEKT
ncbi:MAG: hypothetical protein WD000_04305 [Thermodesulfobacteriota bacterium]